MTGSIIMRSMRAEPRRWLALGSSALALLVLALWSLALPATPSVRERWGVDQLLIRRTADGHLLDLRYQVVEPQRAQALLSEKTQVYLVHAKSGRRLAVPSTPKAGALRNTGVPRAGRSYFALFANPGGLVKSGDQVSVVIGELTAELTVE